MLEPFEPRVLGDKPWGTELLVAHTPLYTGKVLFMNAGGTGKLQYHVEKDETFYLFEGYAIVETLNEAGEKVQTRMLPGQSYHVPPGTVHRVEAVTSCIFFEASTPAFDDRVVVEDGSPAR